MSKIPSRYIVFDTETTERVITDDPRHVSLHFRLGVAKIVWEPHTDKHTHSYENLHKPTDIFDLIDTLPKEEDKLWIFAHNIGFDIRIVGLFEHIASGRYTLLDPSHRPNSRKVDTPFIVLDDPPTIIRAYRSDGQEIMFVDTWQWLSSSLAKIGKILGNAKGTMPEITATDEEWYIYCKQDVDVLDDAMMRIFGWIKDNGYKSFHPTRAGQARLIYQQLYEKKRIQYHNDPEIQAVERPSYYGGFTEVFRVGTAPGIVHQVDANSLYPYVMSKFWYPARVNRASLDGTVTTDVVGKSPKRFIAEVFIDSRHNTYPVRCKEGTIFARGKVRTILPGPELDAAFKAGDIVKTLNYVEYGMEPLFKEFVTDMYNFRMGAKADGNEIFDYCYKLMMNSLYGKFGQLTGEWEFVGPTDPETVYSQGWTITDGSDVPIETRILAGTTYQRRKQYDHPKSFVAIASFVTSYAREYMRSIRNQLPIDSVYYQATDSLYISDEAYEMLQSLNHVDPLKLGKFKHEGTYNYLKIVNIHNLDKDDKRIRGSIRSKAEYLGNEVYRQESWESLLPGIKNKHINEVHIRTVIKALTHKYDRQSVLPGGKCVPHKIDNWKLTPREQTGSWMFRGCVQGK